MRLRKVIVPVILLDESVRWDDEVRIEKDAQCFNWLTGPMSIMKLRDLG